MDKNKLTDRLFDNADNLLEVLSRYKNTWYGKLFRIPVFTFLVVACVVLGLFFWFWDEILSKTFHFLFGDWED